VKQSWRRYSSASRAASCPRAVPATSTTAASAGMEDLNRIGESPWEIGAWPAERAAEAAATTTGSLLRRLRGTITTCDERLWQPGTAGEACLAPYGAIGCMR